MSTADLLNYGMQRIGTVQIVEDRFEIRLTDHSSRELERCIYAFMVGDEVLRIGSSKGKLGSRLRAWQNDVSNALNGDFRRTPQEEVAVWRSALMEHRRGEIYARVGTIASSPVGTFNLYLNEERALIERYKPRCCNDVGRSRRP